MPERSPLRLTAFFAGINRLLYLSISTFSPEKAKTVRMPLKTSSATFAAAAYASISFDDSVA